MYKKNIYKSVMLLALVLSCSCNKYLTLYPQDGTIRQQYWQNKEQVAAAVTGIYASLLVTGTTSGTSDKSLVEDLFLWGELRADNVVLGSGYSVADQNVISDNILSTNEDVKWDKIYATINYCNTVLAYAPGVKAIDPTFTQTLLNNYTAEALGIRALMYFYLVRTFGDVPLKLTATSSDADLVQMAKSPQATVLAQIVADLKQASPLAAFTYGSQALDKGQITKYTINAIQADVYLWMENYQACINSCDSVINSSHFGLVAGDGNFFNTLYYTGNSNEGIFELQFDVQAPNPLLTTNFFTGSRLLANPNVLIDVFTQDSQNPNNYDIRAANCSVNANAPTIWKYVGVNYKSTRLSGNYGAHWFVYRYADILLMKAEACAWVGGRGQDALDLINQIRTRGHALQATLEFPDPNDSYGVSTYVFDERNREFAFEGKRWFDIVRNAKRNNFAHPEILLNIVGTTVPPQYVNSTLAKYQDHNSWYLPIFNTEILNDPNLVQNSFYKN